MAVPAQQRVRLDDEQRGASIVGAARQQHEQQAIYGRDLRLRGLTVEDDQLLPEERVLGHQGGLRHSDVGDHSSYGCSCRRLGPLQETTVDSV